MRNKKKDINLRFLKARVNSKVIALEHTNVAPVIVSYKVLHALQKTFPILDKMYNFALVSRILYAIFVTTKVYNKDTTQVRCTLTTTNHVWPSVKAKKVA